jgi:uncharacterized membrane protein
MSPLIQRQLFEFFVLVFSGIGIAMLRQLFLAYQSRYKPRKSISVLQEMLFWVFAALVVSACFYYASFGFVAVHSFLGFALGVVLWYNIWQTHRPKDGEKERWRGREEAVNSRTAKSSISTRPERNGEKSERKQV